jgi:hypothetical protein
MNGPKNPFLCFVVFLKIRILKFEVDRELLLISFIRLSYLALSPLTVMITPFSPLLPVPLLANFPPVSTLLTSKLGGKAGILSLAIGLRGGNVDNELAAAGFGWCSALGAPAALVAGAVLVTFSKTRTEMMPRKKDEKWVRSAKKMLRFLLLSSFGLEIISIFVTTVTGTVLLSQGDLPAVVHVGMHHNSPMGFLQSAHEFEYLTARITFLQGLFNWLAAVALEALIPNEGEGASARKMNQFVSSSLVTTILMMLSFYNRHMTFCKNTL